MSLDGIPSIGGGGSGPIAGIAASAVAVAAALGVSFATDGSVGADPAPSEPDGDGGTCRCRPAVERAGGTTADERRELVVDATDCPGDGDLAASPACRERVVSALTDRDVDGIRTRSDGRERTYTGNSVGLLLAAGRVV